MLPATSRTTAAMAANLSSRSIGSPQMANVRSTDKPAALAERVARTGSSRNRPHSLPPARGLPGAGVKGAVAGDGVADTSIGSQHDRTWVAVTPFHGHLIGDANLAFSEAAYAAASNLPLVNVRRT